MTLGFKHVLPVAMVSLFGGIGNGAEQEPAPSIAGPPVTLHMIGDSTMANKPVIPANPERGWGQMLQVYFNAKVQVDNHALNGRSTKSFISEGVWDKVLNALKPGDYVIIQFGHNDEKIKDATRGTQPFGEYSANLRRFIDETRERKAVPLLATPTVRRSFDAQGRLADTHGDYTKAARAVAEERNVPLLEINTAMDKLLQQLGPENSKRLFNWTPAGEFGPDSKPVEDNTHFNAYGASRVCDLAVAEIAGKVPGLAVFLEVSPVRKTPARHEAAK